MATVDMNSVQFYHPPNLNPLIRPKYSAMRSLTQRAPHSNADQILESYGRLEAGIALVLDQRDDFGSPFQTGRDSAVRAQGRIRKSTIQANLSNLFKKTKQTVTTTLPRAIVK